MSYRLTLHHVGCRVMNALRNIAAAGAAPVVGRLTPTSSIRRRAVSVRGVITPIVCVQARIGVQLSFSIRAAGASVADTVGARRHLTSITGTLPLRIPGFATCGGGPGDDSKPKLTSVICCARTATLKFTADCRITWFNPLAWGARDCEFKSRQSDQTVGLVRSGYSGRGVYARDRDRASGMLIPPPRRRDSGGRQV